MKKLGGTCMCVALVLFCFSATAQSARGSHGRAPATQTRFDDHAAVKRARAFTSLMVQRSNFAQRALWQARHNRNRLRMRCLDDQLSQLHAIERLARGHQQAVESAVRVDGLTGTPMVSLVRLHDLSRAAYRRAEACGHAYSKRVRMRTQYRVKVVREPALHAAPSPYR